MACGGGKRLGGNGDSLEQFILCESHSYSWISRGRHSVRQPVVGDDELHASVVVWADRSLLRCARRLFFRWVRDFGIGLLPKSYTPLRRWYWVLGFYCFCRSGDLISHEIMHHVPEIRHN